MSYERTLKDYEEKGIVPAQIVIPVTVMVFLSKCPYCEGKFYTEHSDIHCPYCCMELFGMKGEDKDGDDETDWNSDS